MEHSANTPTSDSRISCHGVHTSGSYGTEWASEADDEEEEAAVAPGVREEDVDLLARLREVEGRLAAT